MEYVFSLVDEKIGLDIVDDASTNSTGMNAVLQRMCGMNQFARRLFMKELNDKGYAEIVASPTEEHPYTIFAKNLQVNDNAELGSKAYKEYLDRKLSDIKPTAFFT